MTRFDDRYAVTKFDKSDTSEKVAEGSTLIFESFSNFRFTQCRIGERKLRCQKPAGFIKPFRQRTLTCDRQTDGHRAMASTRASIASRG